jgi:hypothetical protein
VIERRQFLTGLIALVAAPAIVRAHNLMPVRQILIEPSPYQISVFSGANFSLNVGDIISFTGHDRLFVVTAGVAKGDKVINLYPPIMEVPSDHAELKLMEWPSSA